MVQVQLGPPFAITAHGKQQGRGKAITHSQFEAGCARDIPGSLTTAYWVIKKKIQDQKSVPRDGLRHQHSWNKMIPGRITANIKNGFRRL